MKTSKITIRVVDRSVSCSATISQNDVLDPHAHEAWQRVKSDLVTHLLLEHTESGGSLALGQLNDTFASAEGEVYLLHDTDLGDLMLTASDAFTFSKVINQLGLLSGYSLEDR